MIISVSTRLHHVNLSTPRKASVCLILRHQPDRWSDPVTQRQLGSDLHSSKPEAELVLGLHPRQLNRFHNILSSLIMAEMLLIIPDVTRMLRVLGVQIQSPMIQELLSILCSCQCWHDVKVSILNPTIGPVVAIILKILLQFPIINFVYFVLKTLENIYQRIGCN